MDRRTLLKIMGGIAALPALGKAIKGTGIKAIKAAGKVLPKVQGMPEWFTPLVNKIMKDGVDVSPKVGRVEDMTTVKKLEIPSETGKPEVITLTENKVTGNITIESSSGGVADSPFEISYTPPKTDINVQTGEPVKYPGDFSVIENRPKPDYNNIGKVEFDYDNFDIDSAYSDLERLEKIGTGKIKDVKKMEQRAKGREMINQSPYEDIMDRFPGPPEPDDFADGGLASFANGGKTVKRRVEKKGGKLGPTDPLSKYESYSEEELAGNIEAKKPTFDTLEDYISETMPMFEPRDVAPPRSYSDMPNIYDTPRLSQVDLADGGIASMFRERPGYQEGGSLSGLAIQLDRPLQPGDPVGSFFNQSGSGLTALDTKSEAKPLPIPSLIEDYRNSPFYGKYKTGTAALVPVTLPTGEKFTFSGGADSAGFQEYVKSLGYSTNRGDGLGYNVIAPTPTVPAPTIPTPVTQPLTPETGLPVTTMPVTQPTAEAPINSLEKFIAERKFQAEADAAARSNVPFTKTFSDYLPTPTMAAPTLTTNLEQNLISNNLSRLFPENNFYDSLRTNPITSNMQGIYNTSFNQRPINSAFTPTSILGSLESRMGEFQPFANRLNLSQQDAAARVTPRIFGRDGGLTNTIPPAMGPDSQGVESLFRRRYS